MTSYYDVYCQRWHTALTVLSRGYARGLWSDPVTPDALLLLYGTRLLDVLLSWYSDEHV